MRRSVIFLEVGVFLYLVWLKSFNFQWFCSSLFPFQDKTKYDLPGNNVKKEEFWRRPAPFERLARLVERTKERTTEQCSQP